MGNYSLGDDVHFMWRTVVPTTGVPATWDDTPRLGVYEDNSTSNYSIDENLSVTGQVSVDFDGITGLNHALVSATSANGYEAGKTYHVVVTVGNAGSGGVSEVGRVVGRFTIEAEAVGVGSKVVGTELIPELIHYCDGVTSRSVISLNANFAGQLALAPDIGDATIAEVNSAELTGAASVSGTSLATNIAQNQAIYTVPTLSVAGTYTATVSVTTTDSQTLVSTGTIVVT